MNFADSGSGPCSKLGPHSVRQILRSRGLRPRKKLGQNFLVDANVAKKIVRMLAPLKEEAFLEIGAGVGALTLPLAESGAKVFAVEVDPRLLPILRVVMAGFENVRLLEKDILQLKIETLLDEARVKRIHVLGNLPYNITTQILLYLLDNRRYLGRVFITVQREYAERLLARPGSRLYGSIGVLLQSYSSTEEIMSIPPTCFFPKPDVSSTVLKLLFREVPASGARDEAIFRAVVRAAFAHRRKMLLNSLGESLGPAKPKVAGLLKTARVDGRKRAEQLTLEELGRIADVLYEEGISPCQATLDDTMR